MDDKIISVLKYGSSHWRCSVKIGVLRNFSKFTGKHLCQSLFFNTVADLRTVTLLKKDFSTVVFLWILQISKNTFTTEYLGTTAFGNTFMLIIKYFSIIDKKLSMFSMNPFLIKIIERMKNCYPHIVTYLQYG